MDIKINKKKPTFILVVDAYGKPVEVHETQAASNSDIEFEVKEDGTKVYPFTRFEKGDLADVDYQGETQRVYVEEMGRHSASVRLVSREGYLSDTVSMPARNIMAALVNEDIELKEMPDTSLKLYCQDQYDPLPI